VVLLPQGRTDQPIGSQARTYLLTVVMPVLCWYTGIQPPSLFLKAMLVHRPWGTYETLLENIFFMSKKNHHKKNKKY